MSKLRRMLQLRDEILGCHKCPLREVYDSPVPFAGNVEAKILLVGEAPGADEVDQGKPFVGRSGKLLRTALEKAGLTPSTDVFIGNVLCCRPRNNKFPSGSEEVENCLPWIHEAVNIMRPSVIVALGGKPHKLFYGSNLGITSACGSVDRWTVDLGDDEHTCWYIPTLHPSFCLRPGMSSSSNPVMKSEKREKLTLLLNHLKIAKTKAEEYEAQDGSE